jgi:hypothetical protein
MNAKGTLRQVGFNDEQSHCDLCGKPELRGTVILAAEGVEVGRYGTTCASKILQADNPNAKKVTRSGALAKEVDRRQRVTGTLRKVAKCLEENDTAIAQWHIHSLRQDPLAVLHRADELAIAAQVDATGIYRPVGYNRTQEEIRKAFSES